MLVTFASPAMTASPNLQRKNSNITFSASTPRSSFESVKSQDSFQTATRTLKSLERTKTSKALLARLEDDNDIWEKLVEDLSKLRAKISRGTDRLTKIKEREQAE